MTNRENRGRLGVLGVFKIVPIPRPILQYALAQESGLS